MNPGDKDSEDRPEETAPNTANAAPSTDATLSGSLEGLTLVEPDPDAETHRGAFGDYGGQEEGFIDRTFRERIVLVGVIEPPGDAEDTEASLDELAALVDTAGADAIARIVQRRSRPDPATFVGKGKADEIRQVAEAIDADTVVFDDELSPAQQANLLDLLGRTAIDRTAVILDIFARNAHSQEGKAQVELALLRYRLPRLRSASRTFSQQGGGIGTRGPGETQLEVDRRRIERRIHKLEAQLRTVQKHRRTQSKRRRQSANHAVAIVGYTNAGKSTLLNRLTGAGVVAENRLFATLDATTRRLDLPGGEQVFLTDTVGFVRKLPHSLVQAFKSTLDVVIDAELLVHVVDASSPDPEAQITAVRDVLGEIEAHKVPELLVFNKVDLAEPGTVSALLRRYPGSVAASSFTGEGITELLETLGARLRSVTSQYWLVVPYGKGDVIAAVHRSGQVISEEATAEGMRYHVRLDPRSAGRLAPYVTENGDHAPDITVSDGHVSENDDQLADIGDHLPETGDHAPENGNHVPEHGDYDTENGDRASEDADHAPENGETPVGAPVADRQE